MSKTSHSAAAVLPSFLLRTAILSFVWWILTGGDVASLTFGLPVALAAAALSMALTRPRRTGLRIMGILPYAAYFVTKSIVGGFDVARRALAPSMPIAPALIDYRISLAGKTPRVVFMNTISLLPGTLSARFVDDTLQVHVLDAKESVPAELRQLEARVGALFGQQIDRGGHA